MDILLLGLAGIAVFALCHVADAMKRMALAMETIAADKADD